ncbi:MAG: hypothetical protein WC959_09910 [Kiritimatiellales bacterium]
MSTTLKSVIEALPAEIVYAPEDWEGRTFKNVFASDLISDILMNDGEDPLIITSLLSDQILRAAEVIGAAGVIVAHRKQIPPALGRAAEKLGVPLFVTPLTKFRTSVRTGRVMGIE